ncbi:hypothetical protein [Pseudomonas mucidolens]|uniref:Uncharacterized protein n=1 Tax=Pseudomonas mucidolens TaxID=46679 RepID=A0A1H2NRG6_9PSED|nr:hypothetical protein [Pseudomonas mucidolens]SDV07721.1 hypothetical protein SAMN05216202_4401 [Pseudomonas mucidolens]SQH31295.1 Uncharacterised protein [Pseudomonas mucidolens]
MTQSPKDPVADVYRLAEALNLPLSPGDRHVLEALLRSKPQTLDGTTEAVIEQARSQTRQLIDAERARAGEILDQAKASEQALRQTAEQREALIQQWLKAQQPQPSSGAEKPADAGLKALIQQEVKAAIDKQLEGLIVQIEGALGQLGGVNDKGPNG